MGSVVVWQGRSNRHPREGRGGEELSHTTRIKQSYSMGGESSQNKKVIVSQGKQVVVQKKQKDKVVVPQGKESSCDAGDEAIQPMYLGSE